MTIKQAAAKYQVSPQAVYQRLKKKKIFVESLTDKETGELSPEGEMIIDNLFNKDKQPIKANSRAYAEEQEQTIKELHRQIAELVEKNKALEDQLKFYKAQLESTNTQLEKALDLQQQTISRLLPAPSQPEATGERKLSWRERFTGRLGSK